MFFITVYIVVIILILLLILNIKAEIIANNNSIIVYVFFLKIKLINRRYTIERVKNKLAVLYWHKKKSKIEIANLHDIITSKVKDSKKLARKKMTKYLLKRAHSDLSAKITIGVGDACLSANLCGLLGIAANVAAGIYATCNHNFNVQIKPHFTLKQFSLHADCIIKLSMANIIIGYIIYKKTIRR